jgi:hypothetical protein
LGAGNQTNHSLLIVFVQPSTACCSNCGWGHCTVADKSVTPCTTTSASCMSAHALCCNVLAGRWRRHWLTRQSCEQRHGRHSSGECVCLCRCGCLSWTEMPCAAAQDERPMSQPRWLCVPLRNIGCMQASLLPCTGNFTVGQNAPPTPRLQRHI